MDIMCIYSVDRYHDVERLVPDIQEQGISKSMAEGVPSLADTI